MQFYRKMIRPVYEEPGGQGYPEKKRYPTDVWYDETSKDILIKLYEPGKMNWESLKFEEDYFLVDPQDVKYYIDMELSTSGSNV